jgi:hypothetical protein
MFPTTVFIPVYYFCCLYILKCLMDAIKLSQFEIISLKKGSTRRNEDMKGLLCRGQEFGVILRLGYHIILVWNAGERRISTYTNTRF